MKQYKLEMRILTISLKQYIVALIKSIHIFWAWDVAKDGGNIDACQY